MSVKSFYKAHIDTIEKSLLSLDFDDVNLFVDLIINCKGKIFFTGVGKNGHVAAKATSTFSSIGVPCFYLNPVDSVHGDMGVIDSKDLIIAISKSGNTEELVNFLHHVHPKECTVVSIHSNPGNKSLVYSNLNINLHIEREAGHLNIVPTSSIAVFTIFLQSVACEISKRKELTLKQFVENHPGGSIGKTKV